MPYFGIPIRNGLPIGLGSVAGFGVAPQFDPSELFSAGEQGAWYDPSDYSTLFTDSAGTTPVSAPGNGSDVFVGLMLDKSKGLVLGPELVTNGDFSSGTTGWLNSSIGTSTISVVNGQLVASYTDSSNFARPYQTITCVSGATYRLTFENTGLSSIRLRIGSGVADGSNLDVTVLAGQTLSRVFTALAASRVLTFQSTGGTDAIFDNISVRELPGNHAFQTSSAKRPVLRARYNLLTYSEDFSNGVWKTISTTKTSTTQTDPNGGSTAALISIASGGEFYQDIPFTAGLSGTFAVYVKKPSVGGATAIRLTTNNTTSWSTGLSTKVTLTSDWQLVTLSGVLINSGSTVRGNITCRNAASTVDTDCIGDVLVAFADLRPASQATGLIGPTYQRVAAATVYDTAGFLPYLAFDGLDDSMSTNSIDPGAVDKAQVFAGVRKLSDAAAGLLVESSTDAGANNGAFYLLYPRSNIISNPSFLSRGTAGAVCGSTANNQPAPTTDVLSALADISGDSSILRLDASVQATQTADQGTGNYGTYPFYIGARNNASLFFNGWLSSLIVRFGPNLSTSTIQATESWVAGKTGVSI